MRDMEQIRTMLLHSKKIDISLRDSIERYAQLVWKITKTMDEVEKIYGRTEDDHAD